MNYSLLVIEGFLPILSMQSIVPKLHEQFRKKEVHKRYLAVVSGLPVWDNRNLGPRDNLERAVYSVSEDGWITVDAPIGRDDKEE